MLYCYKKLQINMHPNVNNYFKVVQIYKCKKSNYNNKYQYKI